MDFSRNQKSLVFNQNKNLDKIHKVRKKLCFFFHENKQEMKPNFEMNLKN